MFRRDEGWGRVIDVNSGRPGPGFDVRAEFAGGPFVPVLLDDLDRFEAYARRVLRCADLGRIEDRDPTQRREHELTTLQLRHRGDLQIRQTERLIEVVVADRVGDLIE